MSWIIVFLLIHNTATSGEEAFERCNSSLDKKERNIAIILDYDGTCTSNNTIAIVLKALEQDPDEFLKIMGNRRIEIDGNRPEGERVFASNASIWLYGLAKLANEKNPSVPLDERFFSEHVAPFIHLFPGIIKFLFKIKNMVKTESRFQEANMKIHYFIVSAGLKDLIKLTFPKGLMNYIFGCRFDVTETDEKDYINIPIASVDPKIKNQIIMEISKGSFRKSKEDKEIPLQSWIRFSDMIFIGDGPTDIPAFSLIKQLGGRSILIYDPKETDYESTRSMINDVAEGFEVTDMITSADFSLEGDLFNFIKNRCEEMIEENDL